MENRIRELRKERGWTLDHLAELVGTSKGFLSDIETGKREASTTTLSAIAAALGVSDVEVLAPSASGDAELLAIIQSFSKLSQEDRLAVLKHAQSLAPKDAG